MKDYLPAFKTYLVESKGVSSNTLESYLRDLSQFSAYARTRQAEDLASVSRELILEYVESLEAAGRSHATITRELASIRCFYQYLLMTGQVAENPAKGIKVSKAEKKLPEILTNQEIELLLAQPDALDHKGCRDKAMLELLYATGIRASELINLNIKDINLRSGVLYCRGSKGIRSIPVYPSAVVAVSDYIYRMRGLITGPESGNALFVNLNGGRLTRQGFWKIVKGYATEAGITKEITPHTLRHSFALHLLEGGASVKDIQTMMGHADISSTQVYVQLLDNHVKQVYQDCHPKAKLG